MPGRIATAKSYDGALEALPIALNAEGGAPEWVMLLPAGRELSTVDGRGPWKVPDPHAVARESLNAAVGGKFAIDENHSIDHKQPRGEPSPARGWVKDVQVRADGSVWGRVEWTEHGQALLAEGAYGFLSPVIIYDKANTVLRIKRASLVNNPNLRGMAALNAEDSTMLKAILEALGLGEDADEAAVVAAIKALKDKSGEAAAMNAELPKIAKAAGLRDGATAADLAAAVAELAKRPKSGAAVIESPEYVALQSELSTLATELKSIKDTHAKERAEAFVDSAIKAGRVGVKANRETYVAMHAEDPARTEALIGGMPIVGPSGALAAPPAKLKDGEVALNAEQAQAAKLLGLDPKAYAKTLEAERSAAA